MAGKKQKGEKSSYSGGSPRPAEVPGPLGPSTDPLRGRHEHDGVDRGLDERAIARKNAKPRSSRGTLKGPNDRKAATSRKSGKRAPG
jgi:hypothetical protein